VGVAPRFAREPPSMLQMSFSRMDSNVRPGVEDLLVISPLYDKAVRGQYMVKDVICNGPPVQF
jgi:hypothetical protein